MSLHLPLLHISTLPPLPPKDEDPLRLGQKLGRDIIPWLANPDWAIARAEKRTPLLDVTSLSLAALGSEVMYFSLISGLFSAYDRKTALSIASAILPSVTINQFVKARFRFARPPRSAMHRFAFVAPGDFTFPSGHAQNAVTLGLWAAIRAKQRWLRALGISFALAVPVSRVYLGVHYPRDVWAGALLGAGTVASSLAMEKPFIKWWMKSPRGSRGFALALALGITGNLTGTPLSAFPMGIGAGLALGQDLSGGFRFALDEKVSTRRKVAYGVIGTGVFMGSGFAIRSLLKRESSSMAVLAGGTVGLALTFGVPVAANLIKRTTFAIRRYQRNKSNLRNK